MFGTFSKHLKQIQVFWGNFGLIGLIQNLMIQKYCIFRSTGDQLIAMLFPFEHGIQLNIIHVIHPHGGGRFILAILEFKKPWLI